MSDAQSGAASSIARLSPVLRRASDGIWVVPGAGEQSVDFPASAHGDCFEVEDNSFWFQHRNDCISAMVRSFPVQGTILDIGGGNGFVASRLLQDGFRVAVLEPGREGALTAYQRRNVPEVICAAMDDCRFPDDSIDSVACFDVIEHIQDDVRFVDSVHRILKPSGVFYITVPAHQWLWSQVDEVAMHNRRYNRERLAALLAGRFTIEYFSYIFGLLVVPLWFLRAVPWKCGLVNSSISQKVRREHGTQMNSLVRTIVDALLARDIDAIQNKRSGLWGTSILCVARKS